MHASCNQSWKIKTSPYQSYVYRLVFLNLSKDNFQKEVSTVKITAKNNYYNTAFLDKLLKRKRRKLLLRHFHVGDINTNEPKKWYKINYIKTYQSFM